MPIHFQSNLKYLRKMYDLRQKEMSEILGMNEKCYQSYELGVCNAPYTSLEVISAITGFKIDELILSDLSTTTELIDVLRRKRVKVP